MNRNSTQFAYRLFQFEIPTLANGSCLILKKLGGGGELPLSPPLRAPIRLQFTVEYTTCIVARYSHKNIEELQVQQLPLQRSKLKIKLGLK